MNLLQIQQLLEAGNLNEAYQSIQKYIEQNPNDKSGEKLYEQVIKAVKQQNNQQIEIQLNQIEQLINQQNYQQAIALGLKVKAFDPENKKLLKLIQDAYEKHSKNQNQAANSAWQQLINQVENLKKQGQYTKAIQLVEATYNQQPNPALQKLNLELRSQFVDYKIQSNKKNMVLLSPDRVVMFLKDLRKFAPKHAELEKLISEYEGKIKQKTIINKKHYIKEAKRQIKVLYFQEKYDKAIQACLELIKADPKNKIALKFYTKANKSIEIQNHTKSYQGLKNYHLELKKLPTEKITEEYIKI